MAMLDDCLTQGTGLHALAQKATARVVTMASQDDRLSEWPLLCGLCAAWTELGYPVVVLDATTSETDHAPGLLQMLDSTHHQGVADNRNPVWPIFPSALGLAQLCAQAQTVANGPAAVQQLGALFHSYAIVLVYAGTQQLATCLKHSGASPLLTVSNRGNAILNTYQSLKQLLIDGGLQPTLVALTHETASGPGDAGPDSYTRLKDCAMDFLGYQVTPLRIAADQADGRPSPDMSRLALRLLESAAASAPVIPGRAALARPAGKHPSARSY